MKSSATIRNQSTIASQRAGGFIDVCHDAERAVASYDRIVVDVVPGLPTVRIPKLLDDIRAGLDALICHARIELLNLQRDQLNAETFKALARLVRALNGSCFADRGLSKQRQDCYEAIEKWLVGAFPPSNVTLAGPIELPLVSPNEIALSSAIAQTIPQLHQLRSSLRVSRIGPFSILYRLLLERGRWRHLSEVELGGLISSIGLFAPVEDVSGIVLGIAASRSLLSSSAPTLQPDVPPSVVLAVLRMLGKITIRDEALLIAAAAHYASALPRGALAPAEISKILSAMLDVAAAPLSAAGGGVFDVSDVAPNSVEGSVPSRGRGSMPQDAPLHAALSATAAHVGPQLLSLSYRQRLSGGSSRTRHSGLEALVASRARSHLHARMHQTGWTLRNSSALLRVFVLTGGARTHSAFVDQLLSHCSELLQLEMAAGALSADALKRVSAARSSSADGPPDEPAAHDARSPGAASSPPIDFSMALSVSRLHLALAHLRHAEGQPLRVDRAFPASLQRALHDAFLASNVAPQSSEFQEEVGASLARIASRDSVTGSDAATVSGAPAPAPGGAQWLGPPTPEWVVPELGLHVDWAWPGLKLLVDSDGPAHDVMIRPASDRADGADAGDERVDDARFGVDLYTETVRGGSTIGRALRKLGYVRRTRLADVQRAALLARLGYTVVRVPYLSWALPGAESRLEATMRDAIAAASSR